jgi:hypothetical protein
MKRLILLALTLAVPVTAADRIPRGTAITVRTDESIRVRATEGDGRIYPGVVAEDVFGRDGSLLLPRGSSAELIVRRIGRDEVAVDLDSVTVDGRRYGVAAGEATAEVGVEGGRSNGRHVGGYTAGGAILGTIIGAVAGGGKGAAIGAAAGAGAGALTGLATRGSSLNLPVESLLTFRIEQPIRIDTPDRGNYRDGHHYHDR